MNLKKKRQWYNNGFGQIDTLPKSEVEDILIHAIRFEKWLRFYDKQIGTGRNKSNFRKGIQYILSLWYNHGFFSSQAGIGNVEIFTCGEERPKESDSDHATSSKLQLNLENKEKVLKEIIQPLNRKYPWTLTLFFKEDLDRIFHARYLETRHAVVRVDRGFDLFKSNGQFRRNFFSLQMAESPHLKECRDLPDQT